MRAFLAGATGAIGKPLLVRLVEHGHEVTATARSANELEALQEFTYHRGPLRDRRQWFERFERPLLSRPRREDWASCGL